MYSIVMRSNIRGSLESRPGSSAGKARVANAGIPHWSILVCFLGGSYLGLPSKVILVVLWYEYVGVRIWVISLSFLSAQTLGISTLSYENLVG